MRDGVRPTCLMAFLRTHLLVTILVVCASLLLVGMSVWGQNNANLTGAISDLASAPVAKVSVTISSLDRVLQAESDADGQFRFTSVPPGVYNLEFSAPGFLKQTLPINLSYGDSRSLTIVSKDRESARYELLRSSSDGQI
jgi:hypothetical protein